MRKLIGSIIFLFLRDGKHMALFVLIAISFASMFVLVESSNAYVDDNICENYEFGIYDFPTEEERERLKHKVRGTRGSKTN